MLHLEVFLDVPTTSPEGDATPLMQLGIDFRVRPDCQRHQPELTTASHEVSRPFDVFNVGEPLVPGLPPPATDALKVSHLLGVSLPPASTRPCFMPRPPLGFGAILIVAPCGDLPKEVAPLTRSSRCYPFGPCRRLPRRLASRTANSQDSAGAWGD